MGVKSRRDISTPDPNLKKKKLRLTEEDLGTQSKKNKSAPLSEASESEENERNSETDREMDVDDDENDINDEDRESGENDMSSEEENELMYTKTQKECTPSDNESDSGDDEEEDVEGEFEMFDPDEKFYHGIRHFIVEGVLPGLAPKDSSQRRPRHRDRLKDRSDDEEEKKKSSARSEIRPLASRLADCICNQANIGTVISLPDEKSGGDASVVGFTTLLNFRQYPKDGLAEIGRALVNHAKKRLPLRQAQAFEQLIFPPSSLRPISSNKARLQAKRQYKLAPTKGNIEVALFLNERMVNSPHQIVPDALQCLKDDVKWSQTTTLDSEEEKEREFYYFTHVIGISRCFILPPPKEKGKAETDAKNKTQENKTSIDELRYPKFEDEAFVTNSEFYFTIPTSLTVRFVWSSEIDCDLFNQSRVPVDESSNKLIEAQEHKLIFLMTFKKFKSALKRCVAMLEQSN